MDEIHVAIVEAAMKIFQNDSWTSDTWLVKPKSFVRPKPHVTTWFAKPGTP